MTALLRVGNKSVIIVLHQTLITHLSNVPTYTLFSAGILFLRSNFIISSTVSYFVDRADYRIICRRRQTYSLIQDAHKNCTK